MCNKLCTLAVFWSGIILYLIQWPFQEPKLEVPTIYTAYIRPKFKGISPQNMALYGTVPLINITCCNNPIIPNLIKPYRPWTSF